MALTGLQIQKYLPKTNCKECGSNTCLAFALKLAARKAELSECPYVSEEAKAVLAAEARPPIRTVTVGTGRVLTVGGETASYRHEKTFVHRTGLGVNFSDTLADGRIEATVRAVDQYCLERVGEQLRIDLLSVSWESGSEDRLMAVLDQVAAGSQCALAVRTDDARALTATAERFASRKVLLASATASSYEELIPVAKRTGSPLALAAGRFDALVPMVEAASRHGFRDLLLELRAGSLAEHYQSNVIIRRGAIAGGVKILGYPILKYINTGNVFDDSVEAAMEIAKYGSLAVLPAFDPAVFAPLLTLRQNIYTDPQKPIQVEPQVYPIGEPKADSPVFVTTNFSLTYFLVASEIENSGISAWLVVPECEGLSVLTAWAAGKFGGMKIASFIKEIGLADRVSTRKIVIPGYVAQISGELEEALPGWQVLVGPQEAGDIESYVKNVLLKVA